MNSYILDAQVMHNRRAPTENRFTYRMYYLLVDLDDLPRIDREIRPLTVDRAGLLSLHRADHFDGTRDLKAAALDFCAERGISGIKRVLMLTLPRVGGYGFNPATFFYCMDASDTVRAVIAEVNNTPWGERHHYLLPDAGNTELEKAFHVSPFMPMDLCYRFSCSEPVGQMHVHIDEYRDDERFFTARVWGTTTPLTTRALLGRVARFPFVTMRGVVLIYWQALKLALKRTPFYGHP